MTEVEIGWSGRSSSHVIVGYPGGKPKTACGKTLAGLANNLWTEDRSKATCGRCARG